MGWVPRRPMFPAPRPGMLIPLEAGQTLHVLQTPARYRPANCVNCGAPDEGLEACGWCASPQPVAALGGLVVARR